MIEWACTVCGTTRGAIEHRGVDPRYGRAHCRECGQVQWHQIAKAVRGEPVTVNPDPNSRAAAARIEGRIAKGKRLAVLNIIRERGPISCSQIDRLTGWKHQSVSASLNYLHNESFVERVGRQRNPEGFTEYLYAVAK